MRERPSTKIERLERQNKEWKEKYMEILRENRSLRGKLRMQNVDISSNTSTIIQYKESISNLTKTNNDLRKIVGGLESQIKELESTNRRMKNSLQIVTKNYNELQSEIEKEKSLRRKEDYNNGKYEDRWGMSFFSNDLIPNINFFNGTVLGFVRQSMLEKYLKKNYCDLLEKNRTLLEEYRIQKEEGLLNEKSYMEKKHLLGMEIWDSVKYDEEWVNTLSY